jgi:hypothetical protein
MSGVNASVSDEALLPMAPHHINQSIEWQCMCCGAAGKPSHRLGAGKGIEDGFFRRFRRRLKQRVHVVGRQHANLADRLATADMIARCESNKDFATAVEAYAANSGEACCGTSRQTLALDRQQRRIQSPAPR